MSSATFPATFSLQPKHAAELRECEFGSYEDHTTYEAGVPVFDREGYGGPHPVEIIEERHKGRTLLITSEEEADSIAYALASGTFQLYHLRVARRLFDQLLPLCSHKFRHGHWRRGPDGY